MRGRVSPTVAAASALRNCVSRSSLANFDMFASRRAIREAVARIL